MRSKTVSVAVLLGALGVVELASAAEPAGSPASLRPSSQVDGEAPLVLPTDPASASGAADDGLLLPSLIAPRVYAGAAYGSARSGYDGANDTFIARAAAEGSLTKWLALRLEFEHGPSLGPEDRVRVGGRVALLNQGEHGIDGGVALFYDPKDFREEGNIVGALLFGRQFGRLDLFGNAMFGSDAEGDDRLLELRVSGLYRAAPSLHVGVDTRARYNMSSDAKRAGTLTTDWELQALPTLSFELGHIALVADLGVAALQTKGPFGEANERTDISVGVLALGGAAGAF